MNLMSSRLFICVCVGAMLLAAQQPANAFLHELRQQITGEEYDRGAKKCGNEFPQLGEALLKTFGEILWGVHIGTGNLEGQAQ